MKVYEGDCLTVLKSMPNRSVNCCVTSPPYYGLRDYGTAKWKGGSSDCDHKYTKSMPGPNSDVGHRSAHDYHHPYHDVCGKCGAIRIDDQIGLEQTPDEYVAKLVEVFREVKRVLRNDGTLWLNLGDSYSSFKDCKSVDDTLAHGNGRNTIEKGKSVTRNTKLMKSAGLKNKDLIGIPWRVAFALQADGWYLRSDIIWHKPNPMPESVKDRPTKAHEYIFLLAKSDRYYYDYEAIKTPTQGPEHDKHARVARKRFPTDKVSGIRKEGFYPTANKRSVWTVNTKPFKEAHFAVFPIDLIKPCILAGCPQGGIVLDPFNGSGTTGVVCAEYGRDYIGIELNPEYVKMAERRISKAAAQGVLF